MLKELRIISLSMVIFMLALLPFNSFAQRGKDKKKAWPDTLNPVTFKGVVLIDSTDENIYLLDIDDDKVGDYRLAFGPDWYQPESGAVRPQAGDAIEVSGKVINKPVKPVIIVFELNGLLWREPVENWWKHQEWCDNLEVTQVTGTVMVDSTYFYLHYYLDVDDDQQPDYRLNFGPPWYEPKSGAKRPDDGETVTIEGILKEEGDVNVIEVLKINNLVWREKKGPAPWAGNWIGKEKKNHFRIYCPFDSATWIEIPPGALKGKGPHGTEFPDSLFCEMMQVWHDSLPGQPDSVTGGWRFHFTNPEGKLVKGNGQRVRFIKKLRMHLNLGTGDSTQNPLAKELASGVVLKYWDEVTSSWVPVDGFEYNAANQSIMIESEDIDAVYAAFKTTTSAVETELTGISPKGFILEQNYPNPFNPETKIHFHLDKNAQVKLSIINLLGQEIRVLANEVRPAGGYQVVWDGRDFAGRAMGSGTYFYQLQSGNQTQIRRMVLLK
ncbi:T9SS type A sorting domain-containing protein [candidate division KSB1 bacterium]|nr:T9SS type A sorting domain-containing protein [candidate division KSB1 bacterium]